ncbi:MAG: accessory factor UbiK family protein [Alphaproteobacteria bacterium]|nr:MAG: accessory factor UbiK family protein [Alphaproteobacteria bacterium]
MVQTDNKFFDDLAKLATGAAGTLHGVRQEIEGLVRQGIDRVLSGLDLVTREEFEMVKAMAAEARAQNEALEARIAALETPAKRRARAAAKPRKAAPKRTTPKNAGSAGSKSGGES